MTADRPKRPLPHEYQEIAKGSGPAAILLFLQIAVTGYLSYIIYFLITGNTHVFWNLIGMKAAVIFYFPAAFAAFTTMPTNKLTRIVARVAMTAGIISTIIYGIGLASQAISGQEQILRPGLETLLAITGGMAAALILRGMFRVGLAPRQKEFQNIIG